MKQFLALHIILFCLLSADGICQIESDIQNRLKNEIPAEKVIIHLNNDLLLSGETLYYSLFCLNNVTNKISNISKIAYVELIGESNNVLFKHKLKLEKGIAYSQFFIPANVKTGNYKLLGYTKWMRNNSINPFFKKDVYIINPYLSRTNTLSLENETDVSSIVQVRKKESESLNKNMSQAIVLKTDLDEYKTRSKVTLNLNNLLETTSYGNYTLSVRELNAIGIERDLNTSQNEVVKNNGMFYLPEIRGEILSGFVVSKDKNSQPNVIIALSIFGDNPVFKNVITDDKGRFFFNIHENYSTSKCAFQIFDEEKENFYIVLDNTSPLNQDKLKFEKLFLNTDTKDWLVNRSIKNQIENAYSELKRDSTIYTNAVKPFYAKPNVNYKLDDYKRFPTVRETFVEVIEGAGIRRYKDEYFFKVIYQTELETNEFSNYKPLVLIDGLLLQNNEFLFDYSPYKIEDVSLLKGVYFFGPSIFDGIIDITTKAQDFLLPTTLEYLKYFDLDVPQEKKEYYTPNYNTNGKELNKIPDYRHQLLWKPNINLDNVSKTIEFYTSDIEETFEVVLEGYTTNGNYIISKTFFEVKK